MKNAISYKNILYATDLGKHTRPVFRHALTLANQFNAHITMLHVVEPLGSTGEAILSTYLSREDRSRMEHESMRQVIGQMQERLKKFCDDEADEACDGRSLPVSDIIVTSGRVDEQILKQTEKHAIDLVIVGSCSDHHGLLGSTARHLTQKSRVPVLVVPNQ